MKSWLQDNDIKINKTKGNLSFLENLLETLKLNFTNLLLQYQRMRILIN